MVAVALMFSSFTTPMLSALFSFAVYVIGQFSADLMQAAAISPSAVAGWILRTLYYLLPNLSNFGYIGEATNGEMVPVKMALQATVYAVVYIGILVSASIVIFEKRSFK
jgi:hypothetical protein